MNAIVSIAPEPVAIHADYAVAELELIIAPLADNLGLTEEELRAEFDIELIFSIATEYDSVNGKEGFRLRKDWELSQLIECARRSPLI